MKKTLSILGLYLITSFGLLGGTSGEESKIIYLSGESHHFSDIDKAYNQLIVQLMGIGEVCYAAERLQHVPDAEEAFREIIRQRPDHNASHNPLIFGVEDPLFNIFRDALNINTAFRSINKRGFALADVNYMGNRDSLPLALVLKSNQKYLSNFWKNKRLIGNPIFDHLKKNKKALIKMALKDQTTKFKTELAQATDNDWISFAHEIVLILKPTITELISLEKHESLDFLLTCLEDFSLESNCDPEAPSKFFLSKVNLELRDDFIVNNLEDIYSLRQGRPLVCILGNQHIKDVKLGLEKKGFTVLGRKAFLRKISKIVDGSKISKEEFDKTIKGMLGSLPKNEL